MKTRGSPQGPPPVHVHVAESTPVHVHMRRSPNKTLQGNDGPVRGDGGKPKIRTPWIPPGRLSSRRDLGSYKSQASRSQLQSDGGIRNQTEQDEELHAVSTNLSVLLKDHGTSKTPDSRDHPRDADVLLRALVEAEIDGVALANQLTALKETIDSLAKEKRLSKLHAASVGRQQELLMEKIEMFDRTNHSLRDLLRDWSDYERESLMWSTERDALKKRLADSEAENLRLSSKLSNMEREASTLAEHLDFEKDNLKTTEELSRILESTRSHLETQLNQADTEKTRLAAQIQRMQRSQEQQREELRVLQEELQALRQQREEEEDERKEERESLGPIVQRAERAEESARQLAERLQEKEMQLSQALSTSSDWCLRHSKEAAGRRQLEEETSDLKLKIAELNSRLRSAEEKSRAEREELRSQLHQLSAENASTKLENQTLRSELTSSEEKFRGLHSEARQLRSSVKKSETLMERYRKKVQQARLESEQNFLKLEMTQKEARELKVSLEKEKEQVRRELLARIQELEMLPERLKRAEQQLRDAQDRRSADHHAALSELRHKVEQQGAQLEASQQRNLLLQEENSVLKEKVNNLERKLEDIQAENRETSQTLSLKEGLVRGLQLQLEEKKRECSVVSRQLQQTLDDAQRQVDDGVQRVLAKEKASQSRALELQNQLSRAKSELSQLQRSKEDMERRFQTQLQNMRERLDQSDSTNRSLQNYVQFLKTSYGNVFGDSLLAS